MCTNLLPAAAVAKPPTLCIPLASSRPRSDTGVLPPPRHNAALKTPGNCTFGPDLVFVGVEFSEPVCPEWTYQPEVTTPQNLYLAQLERRRGAGAGDAAQPAAAQPADAGSSEGAKAVTPPADEPDAAPATLSTTRRMLCSERRGS